MIIPGNDLQEILEKFTQEFLDICVPAHSVICCRVTPKQKSLVVSAIKHTGKTTLAIGDGGNDVSMIQTGDVGVGIVGREGLQASRAADYSISSMDLFGFVNFM